MTTANTISGRGVTAKMIFVGFNWAAKKPGFWTTLDMANGLIYGAVNKGEKDLATTQKGKDVLKTAAGKYREILWRCGLVRESGGCCQAYPELEKMMEENTESAVIDLLEAWNASSKQEFAHQVTGDTGDVVGAYRLESSKMKTALENLGIDYQKMRERTEFQRTTYRKKDKKAKPATPVMPEPTKDSILTLQPSPASISQSSNKITENLAKMEELKMAMQKLREETAILLLNN